VKIILKKVFHGAIHQYSSNLFIALIGVLTSIYIIRLLSIEDFGIYNFMLSLVAIAQVTTSLGLPSALTRYLPEYRQKEIITLKKDYW
jgi:O-antigen/teichoic acid export membrane protein